jgi:regulator of replication initiation timing
MSVFTDPIFLRAIERIVLALAGAYLGFLGYKLFLYGMASGRSAPGPQSRIVTALYSGAAPGLFFILVAGLVVIVMSVTSGPQQPAARIRTGPVSMTRTNDRTELLKQITLLKEDDKLHQTMIQDLKMQLASARTSNTMERTVVEQMQQSVNAAGPNVDVNALARQIRELSDAADQLQNENDALRTENATLRAQSSQQ